MDSYCPCPIWTHVESQHLKLGHHQEKERNLRERETKRQKEMHTDIKINRQREMESKKKMHTERNGVKER